MEIKLEVTTAHLWFEEIISGDHIESIDSVKQHIANALWYANAMLEGGKNQEGTFISLETPVLRSEVEKVIGKINLFREITEERYSKIDESGIGSPIDQRYDYIFRDFLNQADRIESKLQAEISNEKQLFKVIQLLLTVICLFLIGVIVWAFHRYNHRRSLDVHMITVVNKDLQKALDEVNTLRGIIPICSYCKQIRNDKGAWDRVEAYIEEHSDAKFSHGLCPDCYKTEIKKLAEEE